MGAKCSYKGADLKEIERAFLSVKKGSLLNTARGYNLDAELNVLVAMGRLVEKMYELNDFVAASYASEYVLPRVQGLLEFVTDSLDGKRAKYKVKLSKNEIQRWASEISPLCEVQLPDYSVRKYMKLEYVYDYLRKRQMAIAARYFVHWNLHYLEQEKGEKAYPRRQRILQSAVWWNNQMLLGRFKLRMPNGGKYSEIMPTKIIFSTFPSSGKSFLCNTLNEMFSELGMIIQRRGGMLRVGNEDGNITRQSGQTKGLLMNKLILDIYPENKKFVSSATGKYDPFDKGAEDEWQLKGCEYEPARSIFKTRDSALNSVRCQFAIMDDPSRGMQEHLNINIHNKIYEVFNGDFLDRFEDQDDMAVLLTGTMFNPFDVFSKEIQKALANGYMVDERFSNTYISANGKTVVILNDCEDQYGHSAFPEFISNEALQNKKESLPAYDYHCIWRQKPIPAEGLLFAKEYLRFYDNLDESKLSSYAVAVIDPTRRKASDYFSMPICRKDTQTGDLVLVDLIYERKASKDLFEKIVDKIVKNGIIKLFYEENIDTSLGDAINTRLKQRGITFCTIEPLYSVANKQQRIADMADTIKGHIIFPSEKYANSHTVIGFAVHQLQEWTEDSKNDDFPDTLAMLAMKFIVQNKRTNYIKLGKKLPF